VKQAEKRGIWMHGQSSDPALARSGFWNTTLPGSTGVTVNESTAFTYSVFWACVNNISTDIGSFPLALFKRLPDGGKEPLTDHKLHWVLQASPNPEMSAPSFRGLLTSNALTWGMGYAEVIRDGSGRVVELWPITPDRVSVKRLTSAPYDLYYHVSRQDGGIDVLRRDQMFVLPGSTHDGVCGRNIVSMAQESIGLGLAAERFGGTFFGNGSTFGGVFEHPGRMSQEALKNFRDSVNKQHQGVDRAHKFIIVEENMKYQKLGIDPNAAQFLETRQHQVEEMCRWFRMPPHKVQHLIRTSYNSVEQMNIEYSTDTLQPWCVRWEWEIWRQLIAPSERRIQFAKHNMDSKLRGDTAARYEAYAKGIQHGFLCADDIREKEDMNPLPDGAGKKFFFPQNMVPADRVDEVIDKQVAPDPKPVAPAPATEPKAEEDDRLLHTLDQIRSQMAAAEAQMADHAMKAAETLAQFRASEQSEEERDRVIAEHEQRAHEAKVEAAKLQAVKILLEERIASDAMAREADRLAAEESLRKAVEDAHVTQETLKAESEAEVERVRTLLTDAEARVARLETERATAETQVADLTSGLDAVQAVLAETRDAILADRVKAETEAQWLKNELAEAQKRSTDLADIKAAVEGRVAELQAALEQAETAVANERARVEAEAKAALGEADARVREELARREAEERAAQAEADKAHLMAVVADVDEARTKVEADLTTAQAQAEARRIADADAYARAEQELKELKTALVQLTQERDRIRAERDSAQTDATTAAEKVAAAERAVTAATSQLETRAAEARAESARVVEEREKREAAEAAYQALRQSVVEHRQKQTTEHRKLFEVAWAKQVRIERDRIMRNAGTPQKLKAWAEAFYMPHAHEQNAVDAMLPLMRKHLVFIESCHDPDAYTRTMIVPHLRTVKAQILAISDGDLEDFQTSLERLLTRWEHERPAAIADAIMQEEVTYVRSL